jgi:hypothetical protein
VLHPQAKQTGVVKTTENLKYRVYICAKTRGVKAIFESLGSRLVSGNYHENKLSVVMEMA